MAPRLSPTPHYYRDNSGKEGPARTLFIACEGSVRKLDSAYWMGGGVSKELVLKDMNVAGVPAAQYIRMSTEHQRYSRSEEHTSELQSLMRISYAVFCLKKKTQIQITTNNITKRQTNNRVHTQLPPQ